MNARSRLILVAAVALLVASCVTVPLTGRQQLNLVSDQQLIGAANNQFSRFMAAVHKKNAVLTASESPKAAQAVTSVERVSNQIIDAAGLRERYAWQTVIIKAREANAFVMPNGKIVVFTGLLSVTQNEAGLAAVLGHEVAHVVARHQAERVSQALIANTALGVANVALAVSDTRYAPYIAAALGLGAQFGVLLPFSREHESEADRIGLIYMAKAGYDPEEAIRLWERMEAKSGSGPWEFLSTHPSPETRRSQIRAWLPDAKLYFADRSRALPTNLADLTAVTEAQVRQAALAPIAARPSLAPGFWYKARSANRATPITARLTKIERCGADDCYVVESDTGVTNLYSPDHGLREQRSRDGKVTRFEPALRTFRWPLRVGDSWAETVKVTHADGKTANWSINGEVVAYESISVPAGSFLAFKTVISINGRRFRESWYAPEAKTMVKTIGYDAKGNANLSELIDYSSGEDSAPAKAD